ncbi:MAG: glycosyltransferase family 9 protein [Acidobacteria bacterium]|nr:glycosyltransferase family 9 protein [Acidobacteriota bacterium]
MTSPLQIYDPRERWIVRAADVCLAPLSWMPRRAGRAIRRVLLMRLERIGDLLMAGDAIAHAQAAWAPAEIDLAVGSWNAAIAARIPGIARVVVADVPWLARDGRGDGWPALVRKARAWGDYDLVVNFEPDIRSNILAWMTGAPVRVGYDSGGGGALLTDAAPYDAAAHVATNAGRLIARAARAANIAAPLRSASLRLGVPEEAARNVRERLAAARGPLVGVHASGGRESKQWHLDRFAATARAISRQRGATIVLTGTAADRPLVDAVIRQLGDVPAIDLCGCLDLLELMALVRALDVLVTGDTGPMHLAAAVGTPVVALFGPSNPARYGPIGSGHRIVRVDLPCSPCGRVRRPPERCRGHVPDCMDAISIDSVVDAALAILDERSPRAVNAAP